MNDSLRKLLKRLINRNYVGGKHLPEKKALIPRVKHLPKNQRRLFDEEYEMLIKQGYILKYKKMTGSNDDWHISLNPDRIDELIELVEANEGEGEKNEN